MVKLTMNPTIVLVLVVGIGTCYGIYDDVILSNGTLPDFASLCPYTTMCSAIPTKSIKDLDVTSCCQKCSCTKDCHIVGNCCPDTQASNFTEPIYKCVDGRKIFNEARGLEFKQGYRLWVRVIDTCPSHEMDKAFPACERPAEIQDFVMVSDSDGAKVFKNRQCARCHGLDEYVVWNTYTSCSEIVSNNFESFEDRDQYVLKNCAFMSLPADISLLEKSRCYSYMPIVSVCRSTNSRDVYERELEHACETTRTTQNTLFFEYIGPLLYIYANVYCYYCNKPKGFLGNDICPVNQLKSEKTISFVPFSSILNIKMDERKDEITRCRSMTIWDPFDSVCRPLFCPGGSIPVHGICENSSEFIVGHSMALFFEVRGFDNLSLDLLKFLVGELLQYHGQRFHCGKCFSRMFRTDNSSKIFLKLSLYTTTMCSPQQLLGYFGKLAKLSPFQIPFADNNISLMTSFDQHKNEINLVTNSGKFCSNTEPIVNQVTLQNCPRIELTTQEVNALRPTPVKAARKFETDLIMNTQTHNISICLDKYFRMRNLEKSSGKKLQFFKPGTKMFMLLLFWMNYVSHM